MGRTFRHLVPALTVIAARVSLAQVPLGPEIEPPVPASAPATALVPAPSSEARPLGSPSAARTNTKATARTPVASDKPAANSNPFSGTAGPLALVLGLIAMLAGLVVLIARVRGRIGGVGALSSSLGAGGRAPAGILEVLGRYPLARGLTLVLLKVDRRILLLSQTRSGRFGGLSLAPICELDSPEDVASILLKVRDADSTSLTNKFASIFRSLDREAAETVAAADGKVMTTIAPSRHPPQTQRAGKLRLSQADSIPTTLPPSSSQENENPRVRSASTIRTRLDAIRIPSADSGGRR